MKTFILAAVILLGAAIADAQAVCNTQTNPTDSRCGPTNNLSFTMPTTNTDGSPLTDFATARAIFGTVTPLCTAQGQPVTGATVRSLGALGVPPSPAPNTTVSASLGSLNISDGVQNLTVQILDATGNASACSPQIQFTFDAKSPAGATNVRVGP